MAHSCLVVLLLFFDWPLTFVEKVRHPPTDLCVCVNKHFSLESQTPKPQQHETLEKSQKWKLYTVEFSQKFDCTPELDETQRSFQPFARCEGGNPRTCTNCPSHFHFSCSVSFSKQLNYPCLAVNNSSLSFRWSNTPWLLEKKSFVCPHVLLVHKGHLRGSCFVHAMLESRCVFTTSPRA